MKLNKLIYGVLSCFCLFSCADQMEYKEYSNYDADYVKRTFGDVGDWSPISTWDWIPISATIAERF